MSRLVPSDMQSWAGANFGILRVQQVEYSNEKAYQGRSRFYSDRFLIKIKITLM